MVAAILFIFSLAGASKHETSQQGNHYGIAGMAIALIATIFRRIPATLRGSCGDDHRRRDWYLSGEES
ncbi:NAD(P)(+) transhydrogenase (Re/Si-specific) subunit beta [Shigella flexneri]